MIVTYSVKSLILPALEILFCSWTIIILDHSLDWSLRSILFTKGRERSCVGWVRYRIKCLEMLHRADSVRMSKLLYFSYITVIWSELTNLVRFDDLGVSPHSIKFLIVWISCLAGGNLGEVPWSSELTNTILLLLVLDTICVLAVGQVVRSWLSSSDSVFRE